MSRPVVVLGATGSIGSQTLEVADALGMEVSVVAALRPSRRFAQVAASHPDARLIVVGGSSEERADFESVVGREVEYDSPAVLDASATPGAVVVNGIVGAAGLRATLATLEAGNRLALANKESLVAGGPVVKQALRHGGEMIPVDSEHSALFQCLQGEPPEAVAKLVLTASGGPFRGRSRDSLKEVTPEEALKHPTWDMGQRVTIDSATLFNKGLEVIETHYLFDVPYDRIDVVVHPQSVLHSAVEFVDGSWKGHFGQPDMRIPIQYALTAPARSNSLAAPFSLAGWELTFEDVDRTTFPALDLAFAAGRRGGSAPAVLNAADEVAVEAFLQHRLGFLGITDVVGLTLDKVEWRELGSVDDVLEVDREARAIAATLVAGAC
ncbi:MAG: 1-deoxy-D-xylulose-5-phosphate reductoisomerase [Actinobacteria bacterium]|nr:1-deoxy-D-xylulose-5-phosphate reductoisomerase [Acidobacteriota bacterium]MCZ6518539.1 1-deoxy-D-xylulose-5-phosphate reductoisomerase [Actinomycetota bacterium]MCZ6740274.1 1-deoxy-D-xylulose-5-phosphate reductoisomerase [Actinomycetota bacterium]